MSIRPKREPKIKNSAKLGMNLCCVNTIEKYKRDISKTETTDKWIEELEVEDGILYKNIEGGENFVYYKSAGCKLISLEGDFTIQQLEALVNHMKRNQEKP